MNLIISAHIPGTAAFDMSAVVRHEQLGKQLALAGSKIETVMGCYKGERELAWVVHDIAQPTHVLKQIGRRFSQESVMVYWPGTGLAELLGTGHNPFDDGSLTFSVVEVPCISGQESWTYFPESGMYLTTPVQVTIEEDDLP